MFPNTQFLVKYFLRDWIRINQTGNVLLRDSCNYRDSLITTPRKRKNVKQEGSRSVLSQLSNRTRQFVARGIYRLDSVRYRSSRDDISISSVSLLDQKETRGKAVVAWQEGCQPDPAYRSFSLSPSAILLLFLPLFLLPPSSCTRNSWPRWIVPIAHD